jgi:ribosomal protein L12E/L44/L45/RPP1/RPP2
LAVAAAAAAAAHSVTAWMANRARDSKKEEERKEGKALNVMETRQY